MVARVFAVLGLAVLVACGARQPAPSPTPSATPMLIDDRGVTMPLTKVMSQTRLRPFLPLATHQVYAVLPPLGGPDKPSTRGIAIEYDGHHGAHVLLSEWPAQTFAIRFGTHDVSGNPCSLVEYDPGRFVFSTHQGLIATVQGDGGSSRADVKASAEAAMARVCGAASPTPTASRPTTR